LDTGRETDPPWMKLLTRYTLSLRAKRSNLGRLCAPPIEIASSPAAPRNDTLSLGFFFWSRLAPDSSLGNFRPRSLVLACRTKRDLRQTCEAAGLFAIAFKKIMAVSCSSQL
jgi:hypothetical protein